MYVLMTKKKTKTCEVMKFVHKEWQWKKKRAFLKGYWHLVLATGAGAMIYGTRFRS